MKRDSLEENLCARIPERPASVTTPELLTLVPHDNSDPRAHKRAMKALQRALVRIEESTQGLVREEGKPHRWSWQPGKKRLMQTRVDTPAALALILLQRHLDSLIPETYRTDLLPLFDKARERARHNPDRRIERWRARTTTVASSFSLRPPSVSVDILREVQKALLERNRLDIDYRLPDATEARRRRVHPQGLALSDGVFYLFATVEGRENPLTFALHRIEHAEATTETSIDLPDFDADRHVSHGGLQFLTGKTIHLRLRVSSFLAVILRERPLADGQTIRVLDDDWSEVTAVLTESEQIEWWICSWSDQCEVLAPAHLRRRMAERVKGMHRLYADRPKRGGKPSRRTPSNRSTTKG